RVPARRRGTGGNNRSRSPRGPPPAGRLRHWGTSWGGPPSSPDEDKRKKPGKFPPNKRKAIRSIVFCSAKALYSAPIPTFLQPCRAFMGRMLQFMSAAWWRPFTPKLVTVLREGYGAADLRQDFIAGLTVAIVALPLAMALAIASGTTP